MLEDTILKVIDRIHGFRGESPFWGWLRQIALMRLRRVRLHPQTRDQELHDPLDEFAPTPPPAADAAALQLAMAALAAPTRSVLWLYHCEGYSHGRSAC